MTGLNMINNAGDQQGRARIFAVGCRDVQANEDTPRVGRRYSGEQVKQARLNAGFTQPQLAAAVGVKTRTVGDWQLKGIASDNPKFSTLERVLKLNPDVAVDPSDPRSLDNGALIALATAVWAEIQRRFWELTKGQAGLPTPWPGATLSYPAHLDEGPATHDRAEGDE